MRKTENNESIKKSFISMALPAIIFAATPHRTERLTNILLRAKRYETERANESLKESPQTRQELEAFAGEMCDWATYIFEQPVVKPEFVDQVYLYQFTNGERVASILLLTAPMPSQKNSVADGELP
jgi:hypothetical protein